MTPQQRKILTEAMGVVETGNESAERRMSSHLVPISQEWCSAVVATIRNACQSLLSNPGSVRKVLTFEMPALGPSPEDSAFQLSDTFQSLLSQVGVSGIDYKTRIEVGENGTARIRIRISKVVEKPILSSEDVSHALAQGVAKGLRKGCMVVLGTLAVPPLLLLCSLLL